jgi:hypothetical protein
LKIAMMALILYLYCYHLNYKIMRETIIPF